MNPSRRWMRLRRAPRWALVLVALIAAEIVLQFALHDWRPEVYFRPAGHFEATPFYSEDRELFWAPADGFAAQRAACRQTATDQRLLFFGGSVVYGFAAEKSFPDFVQESLAADPARADFRAINYAFVGYSTHQSSTLARRVLDEFDARLLLLCNGANDIMRMNAPDLAWAERNRHWSKSVLRVLMRSKLFAVYRAGLLRLRHREAGPWIDDQENGAPRVSPQQFEVNLTGVADAAAARGATLVLMSQAVVDPQTRATLAEYFARMESFAQTRANVFFLDVRPFIHEQLGGADDYFHPPAALLPLYKSQIHYNDEGNRRVGRWVYARLVERGLLGE
jgi:lysophospholipase L1-like esterase